MGNVEAVKYFKDKLGIDGEVYRTYASADLSGTMNNFIQSETGGKFADFSAARAQHS